MIYNVINFIILFLVKIVSEKIIDISAARNRREKISKEKLIQKPEKKVYQLKISLNGTKPLIYRIVLVPNDIKLEKLQIIIKELMHWEDHHSHQFATDSKINMNIYVDKDLEEESDEKKYTINDLCLKENDSFYYIYDLEDNWTHTIENQKILPYDSSRIYPVCIEGARNAPPDDTGGILGYSVLLDILKDPNHEEYQDMIEFIGNPNFDSEYFDINEINKKLAEIELYKN